MVQMEAVHCAGNNPPVLSVRGRRLVDQAAVDQAGIVRRTR